MSQPTYCRHGIDTARVPCYVCRDEAAIWAAKAPAPSAKATLLALVEALGEAEAEQALALLEEEGIGTVGSA